MKVWIVSDDNNVQGVFDNEDSLKWFMNGQEKNKKWRITEHIINPNQHRLYKVYETLVNIPDKKIESITGPYFLPCKDNSILELMLSSEYVHLRVICNSEKECKEIVEKFIQKRCN